MDVIHVGGTFINMLMYADDMVLLAPSWNALQSNTHWFTG